MTALESLYRRFIIASTPLNICDPSPIFHDNLSIRPRASKMAIGRAPQSSLVPVRFDKRLAHSGPTTDDHFATALSIMVLTQSLCPTATGTTPSRETSGAAALSTASIRGCNAASPTALLYVPIALQISMKACRSRYRLVKAISIRRNSSSFPAYGSRGKPRVRPTHFTFSPDQHFPSQGPRFFRVFESHAVPSSRPHCRASPRECKEQSCHSVVGPRLLVWPLQSWVSCAVKCLRYTVTLRGSGRRHGAGRLLLAGDEAIMKI